MNPRYMTHEIQTIWQKQGQIARLRKASLASAFATYNRHDLPEAFYTACEDAVMRVSPGEWEDLEVTYNHDIAAWVAAVRVYLDPKWHRWWHRDRTSSDLVETAQSIGLVETAEVLNEARILLARACAAVAIDRADVRVLGRTHGQEAEFTTVGRKFALFASGLARCRVEYHNVTKMSGPVGTDVDRASTGLALSSIGLVEVPSTQIVPRWYLARTMHSVSELSLVVSAIAMEIRLGSQTGVDLYQEASAGQSRGSSAMPQKRNPISSERACGLARLVRSNVNAVVESGAELWNERDISHSSVERVAMVDAFQLLHFVLRDMTRVVAHLQVTPPDVVGQPTGASSLNALLDRGWGYDDAYARVRTEGPYAVPESRPREYDRESESDLWALMHQLATGGKP